VGFEVCAGASLDDRPTWPYNGRAILEVLVMAMPVSRRRDRLLEVRTTAEERGLIDRAVAASGGDLTEFVVANLTVAAQRVLADRVEFVLDADASQVWEAINRRPARDLPGLRALMERPSPFAEE
jgi:uncharacterized protein (DUF1778 family)